MPTNEDFNAKHATFAAPRADVAAQLQRNAQDGVYYVNALLTFDFTGTVDFTVKLGDTIFPDYDSCQRYVTEKNAGNKGMLTSVQHVAVKAELSQVGTIFLMLVNGMVFKPKA